MVRCFGAQRVQGHRTELSTEVLFSQRRNFHGSKGQAHTTVLTEPPTLVPDPCLPGSPPVRPRPPLTGRSCPLRMHSPFDRTRGVLSGPSPGTYSGRLSLPATHPSQWTRGTRQVSGFIFLWVVVDGIECHRFPRYNLGHGPHLGPVR